MLVPRLLALSLLITASIAPVAAQSSPAAPSPANPFSWQSPLRAIPPMQFGAAPVAPPRNAKPGVSPLSANQLSLTQKKLEALSQGHAIGPIQLGLLGLSGKALMQLHGPERCYAIRGYDFTREDPASDATRFTGSTNCQSASSVQLKAVADPRVIAPR